MFLLSCCCLLAICISLALSPVFLQPFFVLHKPAAGASASASSLTTTRARRRIDISQPSSPNPKSAKRPRNEDDDDAEGDMGMYEQLRLEAFHHTWSKIQFTIDVCLSTRSLDQPVSFLVMPML